MSRNRDSKNIKVNKYYYTSISYFVIVTAKILKLTIIVICYCTGLYCHMLLHGSLRVPYNIAPLHR